MNPKNNTPLSIDDIPYKAQIQLNTKNSLQKVKRKKRILKKIIRKDISKDKSRLENRKRRIEKRKQLLDYYRQYGNKWKMISELMNVDSGNSIKNEFFNLTRLSFRRIGLLNGLPNLTNLISKVKAKIWTDMMDLNFTTAEDKTNHRVIDIIEIIISGEETPKADLTETQKIIARRALVYLLKFAKKFHGLYNQCSDEFVEKQERVEKASKKEKINFCYDRGSNLNSCHFKLSKKNLASEKSVKKSRTEILFLQSLDSLKAIKGMLVGRKDCSLSEEELVCFKGFFDNFIYKLEKKKNECLN